MAKKNSDPMTKLHHATIANRISRNAGSVIYFIRLTLIHSTIFDQDSSLIKLKRVIATCRRFKMNCIASKMTSSLVHGPLTVEELQRAMIILLKLHQQEAFTKELLDLQREKDIDSRNKI